MAKMKKRGRPPKTNQVKSPKKKVTTGSNRSYNRIKQIIAELNEKIITGEDGEDSLLDELSQLRPNLNSLQNEVVGRLLTSLTIVERVIEIDESSPGSELHWSP